METKMVKLQKVTGFDILHMPETKKCKDCGIEKPRGQFRNDHKNKDGKNSLCKSCLSIREKKLKEKKKIYREKYFDFQ